MEKETLCWRCQRAVGKCPWSEKFEPVPDWIATPTKINNSPYEDIDSFMVHECPLFIKDKQTRKLGNDITRKSLAKLIGVSIRTIYRRDYYSLSKKLKSLGYQLHRYKDDVGITRYYIKKIKE